MSGDSIINSKRLQQQQNPFSNINKEISLCLRAIFPSTFELVLLYEEWLIQFGPSEFLVMNATRFCQFYQKCMFISPTFALLCVFLQTVSDPKLFIGSASESDRPNFRWESRILLFFCVKFCKENKKNKTKHFSQIRNLIFNFSPIFVQINLNLLRTPKRIFKSKIIKTKQYKPRFTIRSNDYNRCRFK